MTVYTLCGETAGFSGRGGAPLVMHSERETPNGRCWGDSLALGSEKRERGKEGGNNSMTAASWHSHDVYLAFQCMILFVCVCLCVL